LGALLGGVPLRIGLRLLSGDIAGAAIGFSLVLLGRGGLWLSFRLLLAIVSAG